MTLRTFAFKRAFSGTASSAGALAATSLGAGFGADSSLQAVRARTENKKQPILTRILIFSNPV
jgi:hypothetical protein